MENRKRNIQMKFYVTEEEKRLIDEKMKQLPIKQIEQVSPWLPETRFPDSDSRQLDGDFAPHTLKHNQ